MREHFAKILGAENALDNPNDLLAYGYDASGIEGKARIVLFPKSMEEIRQIFTYANRTNIPITTRGLGANPMGMAVPNNSIVIDMAHFDRIHTLNLKEGWVKVDAGVVLSDLQLSLAKHGYRFAINPQSARVSTVGALLAMNQMDRTSHKHGRLIDHVLQLEIIDGTGKHYPDGKKDFIGMEGTCAIIVNATIKIYPSEGVRTSDVFTFDNIVDLLAKVDEKKEDLKVSSLEYLNPRLAGLLDLPQKHHLLVEYEGEGGEIVGLEAQERLWRKRDAAWDAATRAGYPVIEDCNAQGEKLFEVLGWLDERDVPVAAHIGMGIIHPFFESQRDDWLEALDAIGADAAGQFGHGLRKKGFVPQRLKDKLIKLKDEYDYNDILNRGRIHDYA